MSKHFIWHHPFSAPPSKGHLECLPPSCVIFLVPSISLKREITLTVEDKAVFLYENIDHSNNNPDLVENNLLASQYPFGLYIQGYVN